MADFEDITPEEEKSLFGEDEKGLLKKVLEAGNGEECPKKNQEVKIHWSATLPDWSDRAIDSTKARGPASYRMSSNKVCKGLDFGLQTMTVGEKALFRVPWKLAYGEQGFPPVIPTKATVDFEVELLELIM
eukprot:CAMPEP_0194765618 /NCGR_PEP_ID=MMETSP0323_2-20130528/26993_1 /TAXON_ID=2866 ORGANISM="Crypthecodinium cohnii, Strain Seligo" /NCGR_SAMPLE_ID=MMETSP0323_2 /ASSEMBLY_ACC=CAM_ASM_000346 /LENGTH=130 /DNA_ID=CAMNT_0039695491 /DNA_START=76 /DNA_END=468 /DNA_ORIENTATION=+